MGIGESLKRGLSTTFKSLPLVLIFFAYSAAANLLNLRLAGGVQEPAPTAPGLNTTVLASVVGVVLVIIGLFLQAGSMGYIRDHLKTGSASLGSFLGYGLKYFLRLLLFGLFVTVIAVILLLAGSFVINAFPANLRIVAVGLLVVAALAVLYFVVLMFLAPYIIVVEEKGLVEAIQASIPLVKRYFWMILLLGLILLAISFVLGLILGIILFVLGLILGIILGLATIAVQGGTASQTAVAVISGLLNGILGVFMTAAYMNFYLRIRQA